jgi:hypothetical protein
VHDYVSRSWLAVTTASRRMINGHRINGRRINGRRINGRRIKGRRIKVPQ